MKNQCFRIHYLGVDKVKREKIESALADSGLMDSELWEIEEIKPVYEICEACDGVGNADAQAGFNLDCVECKGSGWSK